MGLYKFIKDQDKDNHFDNTTVTFEVDTVGLTELVEAFEDFLFACGYKFQGHLEIVDDETLIPPHPTHEEEDIHPEISFP